MKIITQEELKEALRDHPYAANPDYHAAMSVVHMSSDGKMLIGYWHAPRGRVKIQYGENTEHIYLLNGVLNITDEKGQCISARAGDIICCGGDNLCVEYEVEEYVTALFFVYPQDEEGADFVRGLMESGRPPLFPIQ